MRRATIAATALCAITVVFPAAAQESSSFRLERSTVVAGASVAQSTSFETRLSAAQIGPAAITGACGGVARSAFGFWSVLGTSDVPIRLSVARILAASGDVDLVWSGSADTFQLYRGFVAQGLLDAGNLFLEQSTCAASDTLPTQAPIVFYSVVEKP